MQLNVQESHSLVNTCKDSYKLFIMNRIPCNDEFFIKRLISKKKRQKREKKEIKVLFPLIDRFRF